MFFGLGVAVGVVLRLAVHGRMAGLESMKLRGESAFVAVFVLSLALPVLPALLGARGQLMFALWLLLMASLAILSLLNAKTSRGFSLLAIGVLLNFAVIAANGAMPVSSEALHELNASSAAARLESDAFHEVLGERGGLHVLSDVMPVPGPVGLRSVQSVGDILMLAAVAVIIASAKEPAIPPAR